MSGVPSCRALVEAAFRDSPVAAKAKAESGEARDDVRRCGPKAGFGLRFGSKLPTIPYT